MAVKWTNRPAATIRVGCVVQLPETILQAEMPGTVTKVVRDGDKVFLYADCGYSYDQLAEFQADQLVSVKL